MVVVGSGVVLVVVDLHTRHSGHPSSVYIMTCCDSGHAGVVHGTSGQVVDVVDGFVVEVAADVVLDVDRQAGHMRQPLLSNVSTC